MLEKAGTSHFIKTVPAPPYSIGINSIARIIHPYSEGRVWAEPTDSFLLLMPDQHAKNSKIMYRTKNNGNTIIRKEIRQHKSDAIRQQISTYLIHIRKDYFPIDTRFFTASSQE